MQSLIFYLFLLFKTGRWLKSLDECCLSHSCPSKKQNPGYFFTKMCKAVNIHLWERTKSCSGAFSSGLSLLSCRLVHLLVKNFTSRWWQWWILFAVDQKMIIFSILLLGFESPQLSLLFKTGAVVIARASGSTGGWYWDTWVSTEAPEHGFCFWLFPVHFR